MKLIFTILLFWCISSNATNYYFSNSGNDANTGTSAATAWQTNTKFNATIFTNGDSVFFNCGNSWIGQFRLQTSSLTDRIYIGCYGTGNKPLFTGFQQVTGWTNVRGNIWSAPFSTIVNLNTVLINGYIGIKARYPNNSYLSYTYSGSSDSTLISASSTNYTGDQVAVKPAHWIWDVCTITGQSGNTFSLSPKMTYSPFQPDVTQYFLMNDTAFLDQSKEWVYKGGNLYVYSTSAPTNVYASVVDTLLWISKNSNVTIQNIDFTGANTVAVQIDTCSRIKFYNANLKNNGAWGIRLKKTNHSKFDTDTLSNCLTSSFYGTSLNPYTPMIDTCKFDTLANCVIDSTAMFAGMGQNGNSRYSAYWSLGDESEIINLSITNTGYLPIYTVGKNNLLYQNYINGFSLIKDDGGGIYTTKGGYIPLNQDSGMLIRKNIVLNGSAANTYTSPLYLDDSSNYITIDSNIFFNGKNAAAFIHVGHNITLTNNIFDDSIGHCIEVQGSSSWTYNLSLINNQFIQRGNYTTFSSQYNGVSLMNYNYHIANYIDSLLVWNSIYQSLSSFATSTGFEINSKTKPLYTATGNPTLYYNNKFTDSTVTLASNKITVNGNLLLAGSAIVMHPFTGMELFNTTITTTKSKTANAYTK